VLSAAAVVASSLAETGACPPRADSPLRARTALSELCALSPRSPCRGHEGDTPRAAQGRPWLQFQSGAVWLGGFFFVLSAAAVFGLVPMRFVTCPLVHLLWALHPSL